MPYCIQCDSESCCHAKEVSDALQNQEEAVRPVVHFSEASDPKSYDPPVFTADWGYRYDALPKPQFGPTLTIRLKRDAVTSGRERLGE